jgi:hypothetical protein
MRAAVTSVRRNTSNDLSVVMASGAIEGCRTHAVIRLTGLVTLESRAAINVIIRTSGEKWWNTFARRGRWELKPGVQVTRKTVVPREPNAVIAGIVTHEWLTVRGVGVGNEFIVAYTLAVWWRKEISVRMTRKAIIRSTSVTSNTCLKARPTLGGGGIRVVPTIALAVARSSSSVK